MKTQMIILVLLATAFAGKKAALTATNECACSELTQQADCSSAGCAWVTINGSSSCSAATTSTTCNYTTQQTCDAKSGCAWTNAGACAAFTKCADYTITATADAAQCYLKDSTCIPGTASGTTVPCTTGTVTCSDVKDQNVCQGLAAGSSSICWWSTSCISQDVSKCSTITDSTLCTQIGCAYANSKCAAPTCAGVTTQAACTYVRADTTGEHPICSWSNNACADAADTSFLTATTCFSNTGKTYKWDGSACVACSGSSSNGFILAFFALLAVFLF